MMCRARKSYIIESPRGRDPIGHVLLHLCVQLLHQLVESSTMGTNLVMRHLVHQCTKDVFEREKLLSTSRGINQEV